MRAVVLLSGGIDSTVALALALSQGRECLALSFDYQQRHRVELKAAKAVAGHYGVIHQVISIDPTAFIESSLVKMTDMPKNRTPKQIRQNGIPSTYVPARNTIFLAYAMGRCEEFQAQEIYFGPNALDQNYPDCLPPYLKAFQGLLNVATKQALEGNPPVLVTPLVTLNKREIIQLGRKLKAPLELTFSCYDPTQQGKPCGACDACILRQEGFGGQ